MRVRAREHARKAAEEDRRDGKQSTSVEAAQGGRAAQEHTSVEVELGGSACSGTGDQGGNPGDGGGYGGRSAAASGCARLRRVEDGAEGMAVQRRASDRDGDAMELD